MVTPYFFGYGSLVNRATHDYPHAAQAVANGWRRAWVHTARRPYAYLSAIRAPGHRISGLIAAVPGADWAALDLREQAYQRIPDTASFLHAAADVSEISIYSIAAAEGQPVTRKHPVLLSYIDVVFQGYLREFGEDGLREFVNTTDGWDAPVLDDRAAPIYSRHQTLTRQERALVDEVLAGLGVRILPP